ncbi:MAG: hypothetical protein QMD86_02645 [Patescibacteria group bacterium]|nr:hypothetical protein [Patescibacteria group bacterium]
MRKYLEKIRYSENEKKKPWLIGLSVAAMVLIIFIWIVYMNAFVIKDANNQNQIEKTDVEFWTIFKTGLGIAKDNVLNKIKSVVSDIFEKISVIGSKNSIIIENPNIK